MSKKYIVTHTNPDQDAASAAWLITRFWSGWKNAEILFVPAGETIFSYKKYSPDAYPLIDIKNDLFVHVDTGFCTFDHHQSDEDTCAAKLVFEKTIKNRAGKHIEIDGIKLMIKKSNEEVLERMISFINDIDHFREVYYPEPESDRYQFLLSEILDGLNLYYQGRGEGDIQVISFAMIALDGVYSILQNKIAGEKNMKYLPVIQVSTCYGNAVGYETGNDAILRIAQKRGYPIVVRKDPKKKYVRIKALPEKGIDLTNVYHALKKKDPKATWFLHSGKAMVLNGTTKNPKMKSTTLSLRSIMNTIEEVLHT